MTNNQLPVPVPVPVPALPRPRRLRGFTLVELMVSLTMGLIVGVSVVGLSKEVTNTFHEEARVVSAESGIRTAMDRLRADIQRASMMTTGNASSDNAIVFGVSTWASYPYLKGMAGIRIFSGGSVSSSNYLAPGGLATGGGESLINTTNGLSPDAIEITGNLSANADYYSVQQLTNGASGAGSCGGPRLNLSPTDAIFRLGAVTGAGTGASRLLQLAFLPNAPKTGAPASRFFARVMDRNSGVLPLPQQYVLVCNAGVDGSSLAPQAWVDLDPTSILASGGGGGDGGTAMLNLGEGMIISPVNTVRWRVATSPTGGAAYADAALNPTNDPSKYDLIRTYLDASGNEVGGPDNSLGEVVAEYVVDLKFGGSVDATPAFSDAGPQMAFLPFDDGGIENWAGAVTKPRPNNVMPNQSPQPQRMRTISIRIASRAAQGDRNVDIPSASGAPYLYRYAVGDAGVLYARVRTLMSEVFLTNQESMTYP